MLTKKIIWCLSRQYFVNDDDTVAQKVTMDSYRYGKWKSSYYFCIVVLIVTWKAFLNIFVQQFLILLHFHLCRLLFIVIVQGGHIFDVPDHVRRFYFHKIFFPFSCFFNLPYNYDQLLKLFLRFILNQMKCMLVL